MNLREPGWEEYLDEKIEILGQSITIIFNDLSPDDQSKIRSRESLEDIIKSQQEIYKKEFLLVIDSLGMAGAAEVAREEALGNLFDH